MRAHWLIGLPFGLLACGTDPAPTPTPVDVPTAETGVDAAAPDAPAAELPRGDGAPRAMQPYWGLGPDGAPVCLVIDVGVITAGEWKTARPR